MGSTIAELVGFLVVVGVLWWKVAPPLRNAMRGRQDEVRKQLEEAERAAERLAAAEKKYADAVAEARTESAKIRDAARADAQRIVEEMRQQAERDAQRIRQRAGEELVTRREQAVRELRARTGELAVSLAERLVTERLATPERRSASVDRLLDELEAMSAQEGAPAGKGGA